VQPAYRDFFKGEESLQRSRGITFSLAVLSFLLANLVMDQVFNSLILANIPIAALSFALLAGFLLEGGQ
jgi:hypothetical protein